MDLAEVYLAFRSESGQIADLSAHPRRVTYVAEEMTHQAGVPETFVCFVFRFFHVRFSLYRSGLHFGQPQ